MYYYCRYTPESLQHATTCTNAENLQSIHGVFPFTPKVTHRLLLYLVVVRGQASTYKEIYGSSLAHRIVTHEMCLARPEWMIISLSYRSRYLPLYLLGPWVSRAEAVLPHSLVSVDTPPQTQGRL